MATKSTTSKKAAPAKEEAPKKQAIPLSERGAFPPEPQYIFFTVDGRRLGVTQHTLSYLAGYSGRGEQRLSVSEFVAQVTKKTKLDASELMSKPWTFDLRCASGDDYRMRTIVAAPVPGRKLVKAAPAAKATKATEKPARAPRKAAGATKKAAA